LNDTVVIDGRAYSWRQLVELRQQQKLAREATRPKQLALFELKDDSRPSTERTASGRYAEPTMLELMRLQGEN
jgi:hypothetical protein